MMESLIKSMKRTSNFSGVETDLLIALVQKYKNVIERLKTDSVNAKMKKDAWLKIETEFKSQSSETYKKQYADEKIFSQGTGRGPAKSFPQTTVSAAVGELLQNKMTEEAAAYDSDWWNKKPMAQTNIGYVSEDEGNDIVIVTNLEDLPDDSNTLTTNEKSTPSTSPTIAQKRDWTTYTPADLKSRSTLTASSTTSDGNDSKKHKSYQDKITNWASTRTSLSDQQIDAFIRAATLSLFSLLITFLEFLNFITK